MSDLDPTWPASRAPEELMYRTVRVSAVIRGSNHPDWAKEVQQAMEAMINRADGEQITWTEEGPY